MNAKREQLLTDLQRHLNNCRDERATLHQDVMQLRIANEALRRELARERTWRQRAIRLLTDGSDVLSAEDFSIAVQALADHIEQFEAGE